MRTSSTFGAAILIATLLAPSPSQAQRHGRRTSGPSSTTSHTSVRSSKRASAGDQGESDDYSLAIVSAVLPAEGTQTGSDYVTVVVENRGSVAAPASTVIIAPRNHLTLARQSSIPSLAPGERTTVQLPIMIGSDGVPCIAITITTAPVPPAPAARFLAATEPPPAAGLPSAVQWAGAERWAFVAPSDVLDRAGTILPGDFA